MPHVFTALLLVFKIWMLVDAIRRREPYFWFLIIFFIPLGSLVYFFMVKIKDFDLGSVAKRFRRPPSVDQLRAEYQRSPSLARLLDLADGLTEAGETAEAVKLFDEALARDPNDAVALYGMGRARLDINDHAGAIEVLSKLVEMDRGFREYCAWPLLALALFESGQKQRCLSTLRELFRRSPRLDHAILFAHYLILTDEKREARDLLTAAIDDNRAAPRFIRRQNFRAALRARRMLKACNEG